jgi:hypothetical protein
MIYDFVIDAETGSEYRTLFVETYDEAVVAYNTFLSENWDYVSLRKRTMNSITLGDDYETLMEND